MSADNCVAILKTIDKFKKVSDSIYENTFNKGIVAYRVAHTQANDNFDYYKDNEVHNLGHWMDYTFGNNQVFYNIDKAVAEAHKIYDNISYVKYGIIEVDALQFNFPGC